MACWPRNTPFFSFKRLIRSNSESLAHSSLRSLQPASHSVPLHRSSHRGCSGESVRNVTPNIVSGRVVKQDISASDFSILNLISDPLERPIQFLCIAFTFSGNSTSSNESSNSSEYSVILRNHWAISRCTTSSPHRQQRLFFTCSLASTVSQSTHQLTGAERRSTSPRSYRSRNISWFHR